MQSIEKIVLFLKVLWNTFVPEIVWNCLKKNAMCLSVDGYEGTN